MSLATAADFAKPSPVDPTITVAKAVRARINMTDNRRMPPASSTPLVPAELDTLNKWIDGGALAGAGCVKAPNPTTNPTAPATRDPSLTCYKFMAHAEGSKETPFKVGSAVDKYYNFTFNAPWKGTQYVREIHTIIDNDEVLHHWLLFKEPGMVADGAVAPSSGAHPGSELIHGWAPGGEDLVMNPDVGMALPATGFTIEFHYNSKDPSAVDHSGVEVCLTATKPQNLAAISWLGTDLINGAAASGTCAPSATGPIRIVGGTPHMHVAGTHMKVEILRAGGKSEMLHDAPFDFNYQRAYNYNDREIVIMPGDQIRTSCTYSRPVTFGESTGDEMCYFFTLHYPAGALSSPGAGQFIHGPNTCGVL